MIVAVVATLSAVIILGLLVGALILCCYIHRRFAKPTPSLTSTNQNRKQSEYHYVGVGSAGGVPPSRNTTYGEHSGTCNRENVPYNYESRLKYHEYDYPDVNTAREVPLTQNRACGKYSSDREVDELRENVAYNQVPNLQYQEYADVVGKSAGDVPLTQNRADGEHPSNKEVELHDNIAYNYYGPTCH